MTQPEEPIKLDIQVHNLVGWRNTYGTISRGIVREVNDDGTVTVSHYFYGAYHEFKVKREKITSIIRESATHRKKGEK